MPDSSPAQFVGVDVGTSRIVVQRSLLDQPPTQHTELNAYIELPNTPAVLTSLRSRKVPCRTEDGRVLAFGKWSTTFAELFHSEVCRPMSEGCVNGRDERSTYMLEALLTDLLGKQVSPGSPLVFSVPSQGVDGSRPGRADLAFHQTFLQQLFTRLGYRAVPLHEGEAVVYSELAEENYTGIGISFGAGLCNISFTYLSVPIIDFHLARGGDWIDASAAAIVNEKTTRVRVIKERGFSLRQDGGTFVNQSLNLFYRQLIEEVVQEMCTVFSNHDELPVLEEPVPVVLAGGTAMPAGFAEQFSQALMASSFPLKISGYRLASDPLNAVADGCYRYAKANFSA